MILIFVAAMDAALLKVNVPASELILTAVVDNVIAPAKVLLPDIFRREPAELTPALTNVNGSAAVVIPPCISNAAPEETEVAPAVVPSAFACWIFKTPAETVTAPV